MVLFQLRNPSIRRIQLGPYARHMFGDFDNTLCEKFAISPLGLQCEVLEIRVISPDSVVNLSNSINNLRAMTVHVRNDIRVQPCRKSTELMEWMQNHLPTRCWIQRCTNDGGPPCFTIHLWIASQ